MTRGYEIPTRSKVDAEPAGRALSQPRRRPPQRERSKPSEGSPFAAWESFYVIVGSSAAALTGLMFVVIALIAESKVRSSDSESVAAFGTPSSVHFCAVLFVSAALSAPWHRLSG